MRDETWVKAWAPPLALTGVPLLVAALATAIIPSRSGAWLSSHRGASASDFSESVQNAPVDMAPSEDPPSTPFQGPPASQASPPRSRGFSPVLERDAPAVAEPLVIQAQPEPGARVTVDPEGTRTRDDIERPRMASVSSAGRRSTKRRGVDVNRAVDVVGAADADSPRATADNDGAVTDPSSTIADEQPHP